MWLSGHLHSGWDPNRLAHLLSGRKQALCVLTMRLCSCGTSTQDSEVHLLQNAKRFAERIQQQRIHLQQADKFPEAFSTEVSKMREQLLKYQNEYNAVKEREYHNQYRLNR